MITSDSKVRRNPQVAARELAGGEGGVLLHLGSGRYHGLNEVGRLVWECLDDDRTVGEVVEAVRARVDDAPPELESDVIVFLESVRERGLVDVE